MGAPSYNVVFEYNAGNYAGNRYFTSFDNKEELDKIRHEYGDDKREKIIAEGVTNEKAQALRRAHSAYYLRTILLESTEKRRKGLG